MHYLSTRNKDLKESFNTILLQGLSRDGGLFMPSVWPKISLEDLLGQNYQNIAFIITRSFIDSSISDAVLKNIINNTYSVFEHKKIAPLVNIEKNKYILELFYGPTYAFKDYALQFLNNLFVHVLQNSSKKITILGATSGDTGSAAINAFKRNEKVNVFILHPYQMISEVQRRQMTTVLNKNIHNIAIRGTFDDCQNIIKNLFVDNDLQSKTSLTAINSINWARLIAQTVYFFWAFIQLNPKEINFIVPTGNFGNVFSARIAKYMGLPIKKLHIVTNSNDILHQTIREGRMKINSVKKTYSPSMDIQVSSNFERQMFESSNRDSDLIKTIMDNFSKNGEEVLPKHLISDMQDIYDTSSVSDLETIETIKFFNEKHNYIADPHTATGLYVLKNINSDIPTVSLGCAHPAKFSEAILKATNKKPVFPKNLNNIFDLNEKMIILDNNKSLVKSHIINSI